METINTTTVGNDFLPEISIGGGFVFIGESAKSIYLFIAAFAIAVIPGAGLAALLEKFGASYSWLNVIIIMLSLSMLPMILCMLGSGVAPWKVFRYDLIICIIAKTFRPYVLTAMITFIALPFSQVPWQCASNRDSYPEHTPSQGSLCRCWLGLAGEHSGGSTSLSPSSARRDGMC